MPPQPFTNVLPGYSGILKIHADAISLRPNQAAMAMRVISIWAYTDSRLVAMTNQFLKADFEIVCDMLQALSSSEGRKAAIMAAARAALPTDDYNLLTAVMKVTKGSRDRRNDFAHHIWGAVDALGDALLLINPRFLAKHDAENEALGLLTQQQIATRLAGHLPAPPSNLRIAEFDMLNVMVFRPNDLEEDIKNANEANRLVQLLAWALGGPNSDEARSELLRLRSIRQALERLSNGRGQ